MPTDPKAQMADLQADTDALLLLLIADWAAGIGTWSVHASVGADALVSGYAQAYALGRALGGNLEDLPAEDAAAASEFWSTEKPYWDGLTQDVTGGQYGTPGSETDPPQTEALGQRATMYPNKYAVVGNQAWLSEIGEAEPEIYWLLDDGAEHCEECPDWAAGSPYSWDTLPAYPGDGASACKSNCRCRLEVNGDTGFDVR